MRKRTALLLAASIIMSLVFASCNTSEPEDNTQVISIESEQVETGELAFTANGEDFIRSGFVSSDGWHITFRHVYVTLSDITAYQTDPPYDPHSEEEITGNTAVDLEGIYTIDLVEAGPVPVGSLMVVPTGHYNALSWSMVPSTSGPSAGYTIYIDAQAEKDDQSYNIFLGFENSYFYTAGEYVGDERKGFVTSEEAGDLEMTFHFDHIFGDMNQSAETDLNIMAVGFEPFAQLMQEGTVDENLASLSEVFPEDTYNKLLEALSTLGHTGEGHCRCTVVH